MPVMPCVCLVQASAVGKVVVSAPQSAWPELRTAASTAGCGGTVLITGGTGALGLLIASWLVGQQGVGHLVLLSRAGKAASASADSPAGRQLQSLLAGNASVSIVAADTAAASDSAAAVDVVRQGLGGPLTGVVHAAGVLEDGALRNQSMSGLRRWVILSNFSHHAALSHCRPDACCGM